MYLLPLFFAVVLLGLGLAIRAYSHLRLLKRIEWRRVHAAGSAYPTIADFSPSFLEPAQPLMPPIVLRYTWQALAYWGVFGFVQGVAIAQPWRVLSLIALWIPLGLIWSCLILSFRLTHRLRVEATQYGLTSVSGVQSKQISWEEARLFVCYKVPGLFSGRKTTVTYELSGPGKLVQWTRTIDTRSPFAIWRPVLPMDEYQRQMQQFCEMVVAKTGPQLHDLSEAEPATFRADLRQEHTIIQFQARD